MSCRHGSSSRSNLTSSVLQLVHIWYVPGRSVLSDGCVHPCTAVSVISTTALLSPSPGGAMSRQDFTTHICVPYQVPWYVNAIRFLVPLGTCYHTRHIDKRLTSRLTSVGQSAGQFELRLLRRISYSSCGSKPDFLSKIWHFIKQPSYVVPVKKWILQFPCTD